MEKDRALFALSLAMKAGKLKAGAFPAEAAVKGGDAYLLVMAEDASENTKKKFRDMCAFRGVPWVEYGTMAVLGRRIGKEDRAVIAVTDRNFGTMVRDAIGDGGGERV